jgi:hypothetical protein
MRNSIGLYQKSSSLFLRLRPAPPAEVSIFVLGEALSGGGKFWQISASFGKFWQVFQIPGSYSNRLARPQFWQVLASFDKFLKFRENPRGLREVRKIREVSQPESSFD